MANVDDRAAFLTAGQGPPLAEALADVAALAAYPEWFAEEAKRLDGEIIPGAERPSVYFAYKATRWCLHGDQTVEFPDGMVTRKVVLALALAVPARQPRRTTFPRGGLSG